MAITVVLDNIRPSSCVHCMYVLDLEVWMFSMYINKSYIIICCIFYNKYSVVVTRNVHWRSNKLGHLRNSLQKKSTNQRYLTNLKEIRVAFFCRIVCE